MKKLELIHLHDLFDHVAEYLEVDKGERYRQMEVRPTSVHKSKTNHEYAIWALLEEIETEITEEGEVEEYPATTNEPYLDP